MKKLDDLPKGKPNTYDEVMKALAALHKGVLKQAALYGGKNSKLFIPQVVEDELSLLKSVAMYEQDEEDTLEFFDKHFEALADHLKNKGDDKALSLLRDALRSLTDVITLKS